jgi:N-acetylmuramoyl-L-alanine amidase
MPALAVLLLASVAMASAKDEYARGVSAFNSLVSNEKRAGLRAEWEAVMKPFQRSLAADPKGEYAPKSMFFLGRSLEELSRRSFAGSDRKAALDAYDRLLAAFPKHSWADDALYRKGLIWQEQAKDAAKAEGVFKAVLDTYPKGDMAPQARERLTKLRGGGQAPAGTGAGVVPAPAKAGPGEAKAQEGKQPAAAAASKTGEDKAVPVKAASGKAGPAPTRTGVTLQGIRHWSSSDYTRVVMDLTGDVKYERSLVEKAGNGGRQLQITLQDAGVGADVMPERTIQDGILSHIRVGAGEPAGVLVTFDLMRMDHYRVFTLPDPYRVVLDIYGANGGDVPQNAQGEAPKAEAGPRAEATPKSEPASKAVEKASTKNDVDHVQAALAELQAKKGLEPPPEPSRKAEAKGSAAKPAPATPRAAVPVPESIEPEKTPEMAVSAKQKKYSGTLVEQLGLKVRTIMIDAGHGGKDPGAVANGVEEKDINLRMAKILGRALQEQGFEVHFTRTTDKFIPLEERTAMANAKNADLFISLHCNALKDTSVKGLEVYYLNLATDAQAVRVAARENGVSAKKISDMQFILSDLMLNSKINESRQMAALVEQETVRAMRARHGLVSHGSKGAFFYVLTGARMPSILVELGYLTNAAEARNLDSDAYLADLAKGLTSGVLAYKKKLERFALNTSGKS